jgi:uncharacterized protein YecT (DUF1311 family)
MQDKSHAASFDCAEASSKLDKLICNDKSLSSLDMEMAQLYHQARTNMNDKEKKELLASQRNFLRNRKSVCSIESGQEPRIILCLKGQYALRIRELRTEEPSENNLVKEEKRNSKPKKPESKDSFATTRPYFGIWSFDGECSNPTAQVIFNDKYRALLFPYVGGNSKTGKYRANGSEVLRIISVDKHKNDYILKSEGREGQIYEVNIRILDKERIADVKKKGDDHREYLNNLEFLKGDSYLDNYIEFDESEYGTVLYLCSKNADSIKNKIKLAKERQRISESYFKQKMTPSTP